MIKQIDHSLKAINKYIIIKFIVQHVRFLTFTSRVEAMFLK